MYAAGLGAVITGNFATTYWSTTIAVGNADLVRGETDKWYT